jgi:hypothetical protein
VKKYTLLGAEKVSPSEPKKEFGAQNQHGRVTYPSIGNFTWIMKNILLGKIGPQSSKSIRSCRSRILHEARKNIL